MNIQPIEKRFFFHASAVALAGHVRRPADFYIPAVASTCLPVTGGIGKAASEAAHFGDLLSYRSASTAVSGDFADKSEALKFTNGNHGDNDLATQTSSEAFVGGLKLSSGGRVLEVESLEARMAASSDRIGAAQFHTLSADFQGVKIDGVPLRIATHCELFTTHPTKELLAQDFANNPEFRSRYSHFFFGDSPARSRLHSIPEANGIIYGTVVSGLNWDGDIPKGTALAGNSIKIEGLGSLYFGEILIEAGFRRLTLLLFQLGSPTGGEGSVVEVQTNGSSWPPRKSPTVP